MLQKLVFDLFCSTPLTSTGWVRTTTFSLGNVHHLSTAAVIESLLFSQEFFLWKNLQEELRIKPGLPGRWAWTLLLCYGDPPSIWPFWLTTLVNRIVTSQLYSIKPKSTLSHNALGIKILRTPIIKPRTNRCRARTPFIILWVLPDGT